MPTPQKQRTIGPRLRDIILKAYSQYCFPHHLATGVMYNITRWRWKWFKDPFIKWFIRTYNVDMSLARQSNVESYEHFNAFFTRELHSTARSQPDSSEAVLCPADGAISELGDIENGKLLQAKGQYFSLADLLAGDDATAGSLEEGKFATVYLSPRDYHRIHLPLAGRLKRMTYVPGRLFSVNTLTTAVIPRVFARNERVVLSFETNTGPMILVMVGAIFVGSMETVWHGQVTPPYRKRVATWSYDDLDFERGAEVGRFNMGSTVILVLPNAAVEWSSELAAGSPVEVLQSLGRKT